MINLNEVKVSSQNPVFNNGIAGEVIVKITVGKKKVTDAPNKPDWTVTFTDKDGRSINEGFYYLDETKYATTEKFNNHLKYEAARLKHLVNALFGDIQFPAFNTTKEMLDWCMTTLAKQNNATVKIGATYGTVKRPNNKGYIGLKQRFQFICNVNESIGFNKNDLMERPTPTDVKPEDPQEDSVKDLPWD